MKYLLIIPVSLALSFCSNKNQVVEKASTKEIQSQEKVHQEDIERDELIQFWDLFKDAIIEDDTIALSTMLSDSIDIECPKYPDSPLPKLSSNQPWKASKEHLLNFFDDVFSHPYLYLLKQYDIREDIKLILVENVPDKFTPNWSENMFLYKNKGYFSSMNENEIKVVNANYQSHTIKKKNIWIYSMGYYIPEGFSQSSINFYFGKEDSHIKLFKITTSYLELTE